MGGRMGAQKEVSETCLIIHPFLLAQFKIGKHLITPTSQLWTTVETSVAASAQVENNFARANTEQYACRSAQLLSQKLSVRMVLVPGSDQLWIHRAQHYRVEGGLS